MGTVVNRERLFSLFRDMVDIYSPSGREEELSALLEQELEGTGLVVEKQPVDETRNNLLISAGGASPDTLFLGHIDTVPAYDIEHCGFSQKDGLCFGLGTADMKGGCAAMLEAFIVAAEQGALPESALLALVVGEEETGDGTQALLASRTFRSALVAEPTSLQPCFEHFGYVELLVRTFGYRRHAAMSDRDTNAIHAMLRFLVQLEDRIENDEPASVLNIRDLHSSESGFAVPDCCAVAVDLHIPPDVSVRDYSARLKIFVEEALSESRASRCEIDFPTLADGFRVEPAEPLPGALKDIFQTLEKEWVPGSFRSHSDANLLRDAGCRPVILGPGQLAKAHTRDESIDFEQISDAAEIYLRLLKAC